MVCSSPSVAAIRRAQAYAAVRPLPEAASPQRRQLSLGLGLVDDLVPVHRLANGPRAQPRRPRGPGLPHRQRTPGPQLRAPNQVRPQGVALSVTEHGIKVLIIFLD